MKVLVYENRKTDPIIWDASTPESQAWALRELFDMLHDWGCYGTGEMDEDETALYEKAAAGDDVALFNFLFARRDYEYEWFEIVAVTQRPNF